MNGGKNNNINDFAADHNTNYGVWIRGGSSNQVNPSETDDNGKVGVFVGCSSTGPISAACSPKGPASKSNKIFDVYSVSGNGKYGVAIDLGNTGNNVSDVDASDNGTDDMFDANSGCDNDRWYYNEFDTASAGCID